MQLQSYLAILKTSFLLSIPILATTIPTTTNQSVIDVSCILTLDKLSQALSPCGVPNTSAPGENISCNQALPFIQNALTQYGLTTPGQIAFFLSVVSVESGNLSYNKNHFPGRPGQGTRSMMMPQNLYYFLKENPEIVNTNSNLKSIISKPYNDEDNLSKEKILEILMQDQFSFLPGAWWIAQGAGKYQNPSCTSLANDLKKNPTNVTQLFTTCLGVDGTTRIASYQKILEIFS